MDIYSMNRIASTNDKLDILIQLLLRLLESKGLDSTIPVIDPKINQTFGR